MTKRLLATLSILAAACGGGTSGKHKITTYTAFQEEVAKELCDQRVQCGEIPASELQKCKDQITAAATKYPSPWDAEAAIVGKKVTFDKAKAQKCFDEIAATRGCSLSFYFFGDPDCFAALTPLVAAGGACKANDECVTGQCEGGGGGCAGTCVTPLTAGAQCDPNDDKCPSTHFCKVANDTDPMGTCTALATLNQPCDDTTPCVNELWCRHTAADPTDKCQAPGKVGDPCNLYFFDLVHDCDPTLRCDLSVTPHLCAALLPIGSSCLDQYDCVLGATCVGLSYDQDGNPMAGTCKAIAAAGATCDPSTDYTGCPQSHPCNQDSMTCTEFGGVGSTCQAGDCRGDLLLYCDATGHCAAQVALGGTCTPPASDQDDEPCNAGTCSGTTCALMCQ